MIRVGSKRSVLIDRHRHTGPGGGQESRGPFIGIRTHLDDARPSVEHLVGARGREAPGATTRGCEPERPGVATCVEHPGRVTRVATDVVEGDGGLDVERLRAVIGHGQGPFEEGLSEDPVLYVQCLRVGGERLASEQRDGCTSDEQSAADGADRLATVR